MDQLEPDGLEAAHDALRELRARAEKRRRLVTQVTNETMPEMAQRLIQELQVHQIELEMQYEELLMAQTQAQAAQARYVDLYEFAPVGYFTLDANGLIQQLNLRASQLLGTPRLHLVGRRFALFVPLAERDKLLAFLRDVLATDHRQTCELAMQREDGTPFFALLEGAAVPDNQGQPQCRVALMDVTERRRALDALAASETRFRTLFEQNQDATLLLLDNHFVDCNAAALHQLGAADKEQIVGRHAAALSPPAQPDGRCSFESATAYLAEALRRGWNRHEWVRQRLNGEEFWQEILLTTIHVNGQVLVHTVWRDITQRKLDEQRLRDQDEQLRLALTAARSGVWGWDFRLDRLYADEQARAVFGPAFSAERSAVQVLDALVHPADADAVQQALQQAAKGQHYFDVEHRLVLPDGRLRYVSATGQIQTDEQGQPLRLHGLVRDVTSRREAEEELNYKNRLLEHLLSKLPVFLAHLAPSGEFLDMVGAGLKRMRLSPNELRGRNAYQIFPAIANHTRRLLAGEDVNFVGSGPHDDEWVYFQIYGFFDEQQQRGVVLGIDVTESERMKETLQAEKDFSRSLLDNSLDAVIALDAEHRIVAWNQVAAQFSGRTEAEALGQDFFTLFPHFDTPDNRDLAARVETGERVEVRNRAFRYHPGAYDAYLMPLHGADGQPSGVLMVVRDVTERNRLVEETTQLKLRQQQEVLATILTTQEEERKRIAEALHNGVGQLLYATKLNFENSLASGGKRSSALSLLDEAIKATRTISFELTPGILEDFGLKIALEELSRRIPKQNLRINMYLTGLEAPRPRLVEVAVYRVVQELLNNVIKHAQAREVHLHVAHEDHHMYISVEDDGVGMPVRADGDPIKGIGLAGIRNRIDLLGGKLSIDSRPGRGTIITIEFQVN